MNTPQRKKPGSTGEGDYFHVELIPSKELILFKARDVGRKGHSQMVVGQREDGSWATQKWLISKEDAFISDRGELMSENPKVSKILDSFKGDISHNTGDIFMVRSHRAIKKRCPEQAEDGCYCGMYFKDYAEYEKYYDRHISEVPR